mmetsp:Transcript_41742/g.103887  ORF Transcript_41742/g.103887 Transcript_41742/m.103887 type:complete len:212 (+) Transcript_41742:411-1046(+)
MAGSRVAVLLPQRLQVGRGREHAQQPHERVVRLEQLPEVRRLKHEHRLLARLPQVALELRRRGLAALVQARDACFICARARHEPSSLLPHPLAPLRAVHGAREPQQQVERIRCGEPPHRTAPCRTVRALKHAKLPEPTRVVERQEANERDLVAHCERPFHPASLAARRRALAEGEQWRNALEPAEAAARVADCCHQFGRDRRQLTPRRIGG